MIFFFFFRIIPPLHASAIGTSHVKQPPDVRHLAASRCKKPGVSFRDGCQFGEIGPLRAHKRDKWHLQYSGMTDETISCNGNSLVFSLAAPPLPRFFHPHIEIFMLCLKAIFLSRIKPLLCIVSRDFLVFVPVPCLDFLQSEPLTIENKLGSDLTLA